MNTEAQKIRAGGCGGGHYPPPSWGALITALGIGAFVMIAWGFAMILGK